jgi:serine/threonine protein phosphatase PrpC
MKALFNNFEFATGSVVGTYHTRTNKNNQDSFFYVEHQDHIIGVVCDGCGSGEYSEVGANIGGPALAWELSASGIHKAGNDPSKIDELLKRVRILVSSRLSKCASRVGLPYVESVSDYFLFTVVAFVIGREYTYIISIGDGFYALNQKQVTLGPFENNAPPYIAYNLVADRLQGITKEELCFVVHEVISTPEVKSIVLGTDGVDDLIEAESKKIPGKEELVGPMSQLWENDLFFNNHAALERRLCLINRTTSRINRKTKALQVERGHLKDDTTLVVIRRKQDDSLPEQEETEPESV